ncbi:hypothetical protein [Aquimarina aggregata]|uniref:hypothetical protein n=1 Tax=Aquimarina aggregata TaxID=1642818 RepID=UPI00248F984F|nr:hypothetical protein [Aquimarina aggregata]
MISSAIKTFGDDIKGVEGLWTYSADGSASDNLKSFLNNVNWMGGSMSREDAAFNTITGHWAKKNGFTNVSIQYDDADEIKVLFTK